MVTLDVPFGNDGECVGIVDQARKAVNVRVDVPAGSRSFRLVCVRSQRSNVDR